MLDRALEVGAKSAARRRQPGEDVEDEVLSSLILMHFRRPPSRSPP
jgi:hypothetical protein